MKNLLFSFLCLSVLFITACGNGAKEADSTSTDTVALDPDIVFAIDSLNEEISKGWTPEVGVPLNKLYYENNTVVMEMITTEEMVEKADWRHWAATFVLNDFTVYGERLLKGIIRSNTDVLIKFVNVDNTKEVFFKAKITAKDFKSHFGELN